MAFVNERITEEVKNRFGLKEGTIWWVVDREHDAYFIYTGMMGMNDALLFELHWEKQITKIMTKATSQPRERENDTVRYDVTYDIITLNIPDGQVYEKEKIHDMIEQAFEQYGLHGNKDRAATVTVNIPQKPRKITGRKPQIVVSN